MRTLAEYEARINAMHQEAPHVAFACYLRRGRVPRRLQEILEITSSFAAFEKYSDEQPRAPAGTPEGGQWVDAGGGGTRKPSREGRYPKSRIKSIEDALNYQSAGAYVGNNNQCASLTRELSPELPRTPKWKRGDWVKGNWEVPVGTPIATFNFWAEQNTNGYGSEKNPEGVSGFSHTGIYLGQSKEGVKILHQYPKSGGAIVRTLPWDKWGKLGEEGGNRYYIPIAVQELASRAPKGSKNKTKRPSRRQLLSCDKHTIDY